MNKIKKHLLHLLSLLLIVVFLTGCGGENADRKTSGEENITEITETTEETQKENETEGTGQEPSATENALETISEKPSEEKEPDTQEPTQAQTQTQTPTEKQTEKQTERPTEKQTNDENLSVDALMASMTLEEKIGQLLIVAPEGLYKESSKAPAVKLTEDMKETLNQYHIGGIIMMTANVVDPKQITTFINDLQNSSRLGLFIAVDEEGGRVARIANNISFNVTRFDSMEAVGNTKDPQKAYEVGMTIGAYLKNYGFNIDLAPVADVNTNPENIVIGNRSFGSDASLVAKMVSAEIKGFHEQKIMTCVKHFPGHGDTKEDTHAGSVSIDKTWAEIKDCEILPFSAAITAGTDMIMASHITAENITSDGLPASMSYEMITGKLRNELGYQGVVITDSMSMGAIIQNYSCGESAVKAISAGVDIILMPPDVGEAFHAILQAVNDGTIPIDRINESVKRILTLKQKYGVI